MIRKNFVRTACPWRITNATLCEAGNLQATIEAGFTPVQSLGAAIDKDVRDAINAGARLPASCTTHRLLPERRHPDGTAQISPAANLLAQLELSAHKWRAGVRDKKVDAQAARERDSQ